MSGENKIKISVIIPTYNRNAILCKTLANILSFQHQFDELIVIDQTVEHEPDTQRFLEDLIKKNKIRYIFEEFPSTPNAKNIGIKNAEGDIILFFDDDVEINENTIPVHIATLLEPGVGGVTGKVIIQNYYKDGNVVLGNVIAVKNPLKSSLYFFLRKRASYVSRFGILTDFTGDKKLPADTCIGCNMSFKKEVFEKSGLFDINFTGNAVREETDLSVRVRRSGYKIIYNPEAHLIHFMSNTGGTRTDSSEKYWFHIFKNQSYFYIKNFKSTFINVFFLQFFDFLRCKKNGLKAFSLFRNAYKEAKSLLKK